MRMGSHFAASSSASASASASESDPLLSPSGRSSGLLPSRNGAEQTDHMENPNPNDPQRNTHPNPDDPQRNPDPNPDQQTSSLHRSNTAPAIIFLSNRAENPAADGTPTPPSSSNFSFRIAVGIFLLYLCLTVLAYSSNPHGYKGEETFELADAFYFSIVTLCTIGYGDIAPQTAFTKTLSCLFVLVGLGIVDAMLNATINHVLDFQEDVILARARGGPPAINFIFDAQKDRMRIRSKVGLAILAVLVFIGIGTVGLHHYEEFCWGDALYLSIMSVTTVGYGDKSFKTYYGRVFASFWLLLSTLAVAKAVLYLTEARINKRHRKFAKWMLHRDLTLEDWYAADTDHNGFISKSEFVIYKLKQMGKIAEKDILEIYKQFNKLDPYNTGKLSLRIC